MTQDHLSKLFSVFGLILLIIVVNSWLASQGAKAILKIPLLHSERPAMAFLALAVGSGLLSITASVGLLYAARSTGNWHARVPAVWLQGLSTRSVEGKIFQFSVLLLFIGVPVGSFFHFTHIVWSSKLCLLDATSPAVPVSEHWLTGIAGATDQIRLVEDLTTEGCKNGIQVYPGWEFLLLIVATLLSLTLAACFLLQVFGVLGIKGKRSLSSDDVS
jgi:hypothetical protein